MPRTFLTQDLQIRRSDSYDDTIVPTEANYETNTVSLEDDLNCARSMLSELRDVQAGNWWDALTAPTGFSGEGAAARGVQDVSQQLWNCERKRVLRRRAVIGANIGPISAGDQYVILDAAGELPGNTTAAVGAVATRGTIVAYEASFGTATLTEVAGSSTIAPKNLCILVDSASGDPILDATNREIFGLLQSEIATDGHTINTTTQRVQISFVVRNTTFDDLILAASGTMDGKTIDYAPVERYAFYDMPEQSFLGDDFVDVTGGSGTVTRQAVYDNQGATPVDAATNSILDLEGAGLYWKIRDDAQADLFTVTDGSAGGTTAITFGGDVDTFNNDAVDNQFAGPLTVDDDGQDIQIGVVTGQINSVSTNALQIQAGGALWLDDGARSGSSWATDGIRLSTDTAEWSSFETEFGEVSLFNAIIQAKNVANRAKENANVTANISANVLITGAAGSPNLSAQLPSYKGLSFLTQVDVFINGQYQRPGADAAANNDVYPSAVAAEQAQGAFYCEYALAYRSGTDPDVVVMMVYGEPTP